MGAHALSTLPAESQDLHFDATSDDTGLSDALRKTSAHKNENGTGSPAAEVPRTPQGHSD